jgi:hypothetical protein
MRGGLLDSRQGWVADERLHAGFWRRVETQEWLLGESAALILLFSLGVTGQIKLRSIDGCRRIAGVLSQYSAVAA